jgi:hypothetical protein
VAPREAINPVLSQQCAGNQISVGSDWLSRQHQRSNFFVRQFDRTQKNISTAKSPAYIIVAQPYHEIIRTGNSRQRNSVSALQQLINNDMQVVTASLSIARSLAGAVYDAGGRLLV